MDWSNVVQIKGCKYSYSNVNNIEVFRYNNSMLVRDLSTGNVTLSFRGMSTYPISEAQRLLSALIVRMSKHPGICYNTGELRLFDESEECVQDLFK